MQGSAHLLFMYHIPYDMYFKLLARCNMQPLAPSQYEMQKKDLGYSLENAVRFKISLLNGNCVRGNLKNRSLLS